MSRLESDCKPILVPPITRKGLPIRLASAAQALAATWALKTVLVFQGSQVDESIAPGDHYAHLRIHGRPPAGVTIWIGSHYRAQFDPINSIYIQKPLSLEPLDDKFEPVTDFGYVCFLALGGLSFLLTGHRYRNRVEVTCREPLNDALTKIWPLRGTVIRLPPAAMMDRDFIDLLFARIDPPMLRTRVWPA